MAKKTSTILLAALALSCAFASRGFADDPDDSGSKISGPITEAPAASGSGAALDTAAGSTAKADKAFDGTPGASQSAVAVDPSQPLKKPDTADCDMGCNDTQRKEGGFGSKPAASDAGSKKDSKAQDSSGSYLGRVRSYEHGVSGYLTSASNFICYGGLITVGVGIAALSGPIMLAGAAAVGLGFLLSVVFQSFF